jgi:flagellar hook assembly protein FlgD
MRRSSDSAIQQALRAGVVLCSLIAAASAWGQVGPPTQWELYQNDPNPFCADPSGWTQFGFAAPQRAYVVLSIFSPDSTAVVRTLMDGIGMAGRYTFLWDGRDGGGVRAPDGRYPYALVATDAETQAPVFTASKAATVLCITGEGTTTWSAAKLLFR